MTNKLNITITIGFDDNDRLIHLAQYSGKTKSDLITEALQMLFKTPPPAKENNKHWVENPIPQALVDYNKEEK